RRRSRWSGPEVRLTHGPTLSTHRRRQRRRTRLTVRRSRPPAQARGHGRRGHDPTLRWVRLRSWRASWQQEWRQAGSRCDRKTRREKTARRK
ncbi:hypothetical protein FALBO_17069, partial [Fusarium albosuccineum]